MHQSPSEQSQLATETGQTLIEDDNTEISDVDLMSGLGYEEIVFTEETFKTNYWVWSFAHKDPFNAQFIPIDPKLHLEPVRTSDGRMLISKKRKNTYHVVLSGRPHMNPTLAVKWFQLYHEWDDDYTFKSLKRL